MQAPQPAASLSLPLTQRQVSLTEEGGVGRPCRAAVVLVEGGDVAVLGRAGHALQVVHVAHRLGQ